MNANNPMTPGVYTVEQSAFPPAVPQVPTAVPVFIGYTQFAENNGNSLLNTPVLINSLSDYNKYFGGAPDYQYSLVPVPNSPTGAPPTSGTYDVKVGTNYFSIGGSATGAKRGSPELYNFLMYNNIRFFYLNGGGPAYIISVGNYMAFNGTEEAPATALLAPLLNGLSILPNIPFPKPTLILIPDGLALGFNDYATLQQEMIAAAGSTMDRVAMLDIYNGSADLSTSVIGDFRNAIGVSNLSYATTYYPWLQTSVVPSTEINFSNVFLPTTVSATGPQDIGTIIFSPLVPKLKSIVADMDNLEEYITAPVPNMKWPAGGGGTYPDWTTAYQAAPGNATLLPAPDLGLFQSQGYLMASMYQTLYALGNKLPLSGGTLAVNPSLAITSADLISSIQMLTSPNGSLTAQMLNIANLELTYKVAGTPITTASANWGWTNKPAAGTAQTPSSIYNLLEPQYTACFNMLLSAINSALNASVTLLNQYNSSLYYSNTDYANIMNAICNWVNVLPPASAMAGIYTTIDNQTGVWEAPANVNIIGVVNPMVILNDDQQAPLNVDALAGKSINCIRSFYGRGPAIVWGARTLDGNSLDYRYINVRRTLIMIEQSVANAAFSMVFAPNDANTWNTIQGMISNFLNNIWHSGGLQGAKASDAYEVQVGLGSTMTGLDILNGIMRVSVKVAIVHPAEFIIITYEQKMATS